MVSCKTKCISTRRSSGRIIYMVLPRVYNSGARTGMQANKALYALNNILEQGLKDLVGLY